MCFSFAFLSSPLSRSCHYLVISLAFSLSSFLSPFLGRFVARHSSAGHDLARSPQFDPESFRYILSFWSKAHQDFYGTATSPGFYQRQQHLHGHGPGGSYGQGQSQGGNHGDYPGGPGENPLISRQPIIVLREELEYFSIVPSSNPDVNPDLSTVLPDKISMAAKVGEDGRATEELRRIKREAGKALVDRKKVFTALQRNVSKEGNLAEQHLIDMLCMS